jgi:hypothetical protein
VTIQTGVSANSAIPSLFPSRNRPVIALAGFFWLSGLLVGLAQRARKMHSGPHRVLVGLLAGGLCVALTACGSSSPSAATSKTPTGASTVQIVTSGPSGFSQTTNLTLTVQ